MACSLLMCTADHSQAELNLNCCTFQFVSYDSGHCFLCHHVKYTCGVLNHCYFGFVYYVLIIKCLKLYVRSTLIFTPCERI